MREGEWALFFVDDLKNIYEFDGYDTEGTEKLHIDIKETTKWQKRFRKKINAVEFLKRCEEIIKKAEQEGVELVGFAGFSNALFLTEKWKRDVFADGRCWLVKKGALRFDENVNSIDDYAWTVANIKHKGVLVNQWIIPDCRRYTKGGLGSKVQRIRQKMKECEYLVNKHPDMLYFAKKPGWPDGSHIRFYHKRPKIGQERRKDAE